MRILLDTNVLVSAFAARGLCADIFELVLLEHELVVGTQVLLEFERALHTKLKVPAAHARDIVNFVSDEAVEIVRDARAAAANVSPNDALVLGEAIAGRAAAIVTGDAVLLKLGVIGALEIVSPRQFWEMLRTGAP